MASGRILVEQPNSDGEDVPRDERLNLPSHARRARDDNNEGDGSKIKTKARGVVRGYKAARKRILSNKDKLPIQFSTRLGGAVGVNRRSFVDEIVVHMRQNAPLIGVESWSQVPKEKKGDIVKKVLDRYELKDDNRTKLKILKIAGERYTNWRSNLAATYRAYASDEERLKHKPEEIDMTEWKHLIYYFGTEKFKRDKETNEEPSELDLWRLTHSRNGNWLESSSKELYENVLEKIGEKEDAAGELLSVTEKNDIFHDVASGGFGSAYLPGRGYMANLPNSNEDVLEKLKEQKETNEKLTVLVDEVQEQNRRLEAMLIEERTTRATEMGSISERIRESVREQIWSAFAGNNVRANE